MARGRAKRAVSRPLLLCAGGGKFLGRIVVVGCDTEAGAARSSRRDDRGNDKNRRFHR